MTHNKDPRYIFLCVGKDCEKNGCDKVKKHLKSFLKEEGLKKEITIVRTHCMDNCKKGPNVIFDNHLYHLSHDLHANTIKDLIASKVKQNKSE